VEHEPNCPIDGRRGSIARCHVGPPSRRPLDGSTPFDPTRACVAEAVIGGVLLTGAVELLRGRPHAWRIALAANAFAVVGFVFGLTRTTQGGGTVDIAYHLTVLPLLLLNLIALLRLGREQAIS